MKFKEACEKAALEAQKNMRIMYVFPKYDYKGPVENKWIISHGYSSGWFFKAWPGGRKIVSVHGAKYWKETE